MPTYQSVPGARLFVGGLKYSLTKKDIEAFFKKIGQVSSIYLAIDRDRPGGFNRGFAFVEMATPELAKQAIKELNNKPGPDGVRIIGVKLANEN